jgi:hypothetical protein
MHQMSQGTFCIPQKTAFLKGLLSVWSGFLSILLKLLHLLHLRLYCVTGDFCIGSIITLIDLI